MNLKDHVDTLLVISNDKLRHQYGNLKMKEAFSKADNVLATAAKCITDVINSTGQINVDFADVCTVMKNGGVAILGSAQAEGDDRAQQAIEQALASPLLNDNDIQGAKWILININSAEGEHEFTMDEVEVIQNYLTSNSGEDTDIILGLGYDNTLGNQIGITLIATGFEHKDPFDKSKKENEPEKKADEKIVMPLEMPEPENKKIEIQLPIDYAEKEAETKSTEDTQAGQLSLEINNPEEPEADPMMPVMKETEEVNPLSKITVEKNEEAKDDKPEFFEISSANDQSSVITFDLDIPNPVPAKETQPTSEDKSKINQQSNQDASNKSALSSGSFLAKPKQIYAEDEPVNTESNSTEEPLPVQIISAEDEPREEMQLVVKESQKAAEGQPNMQQTQPIMMSNVEEPALQDETEELRRRAMERIAKLRNLSFNINAADPNNEFETVPAYLRRNMEIHNQIADVESFYSNYTVKSDDKNQADISGLNTFLEGKKPD